MKKSTVFFLIAVSALSLGGIAQAASPCTEQKIYKDKILGKLDFGLKNTLGGWTAIFSETAKGNESKDNRALETTKGLGRGIVYFAADTVGGILHAVTFAIPQVDIPLPNNGVNLS